ncbi:neuroglian-like isoform X2 [Saccostrea cucullata]|uniref:neuroglian-like isoform X2 n=1 Tax=Saccostrea cuccullata TaxID=36930 RepID=UPI002ED37927
MGQLNVIHSRPPSVYIQPYSEVYFNEFEPLRLPCQADGLPKPTYRWTLNGLHLNAGNNRNVGFTDNGSGSINIYDPINYEGIYQCFAENDLGTSVSINVNVRMAKLEDFEIKAPVTHRPRLGGSVILNCTPPSSLPPAEVQWVLKTPMGIEPIEYDNRISMDHEGRLYITNVRAKDYREGEAYVCMHLNFFLRKRTFDHDNLIIPSGTSPVKRPADFLWASPSEQTGLKGETIKLKCIFSGNPTPDVFWWKDQKSLPDHHEVSLGGQELTIANLKEDDAGTYECYGTNTQGPRAVRNFVIRVESKPYWEVEPKDVETSPGASATFICKVNGIPDPKVTWFINGIRLEESTVPIIQSDRFLKPDANNLTFVNLNKNDHMVIQCNASNKHGYVFSDVYLNVFEEETVIIVPPAGELKVAEGHNAELTCLTRGQPKPITTWFKDGKPIPGLRYQIQTNGNLLIESAAFSDAGNYTCHAYNKFNFDEASGVLIVRAKTRIVQSPHGLTVTAGREATFNCSGTTDSAEMKNLQISWLKDNKPVLIDLYAYRVTQQNGSLIIYDTFVLDSGTYTCVISNGLDSDSAGAILTVKDKPEQPRDVVMDACMNTLAEIRWTAGASNNAPILYYTIQYNTSFSPDVWVTGTRNISATQNTGRVYLSPWTNYTFRVSATNEIGTTPSLQTLQKCSTDEARPTKNPENIRTIGNKKNFLIIEWMSMPPIEHNGWGFRYVLTIRRDGPDFYDINTFSISDWRISHWEQQTNDIFTPYIITIRATNVVGDSTARVQQVKGYSAEGIPTIAVTDFTIDQTVTESSVTFYWDWDENLNTPQPGTPVQGIFRGFKIQYWVRGQKEQTFQEAEIPVSELTLRYARRKKRATQSYKFTLVGLQGNQDYEAQMRVMNTYYAGPPSVTVSFATLSDVSPSQE